MNLTHQMNRGLVMMIFSRRIAALFGGLALAVSLAVPALADTTVKQLVGKEKREALERAKDLSPEEAPVAAILPGTIVHWAES